VTRLAFLHGAAATMESKANEAGRAKVKRFMATPELA